MVSPDAESVIVDRQLWKLNVEVVGGEARSGDYAVDRAPHAHG